MAADFHARKLTVNSTCFVSVLRLVYIYPMAVNPDQTWHSPLLCIWSAVELNIAIICSCAPTLRCLIQSPTTDLAAVPIAMTPLLQPSTRTRMLRKTQCSSLEISPRSKLVRALLLNTRLLVCRRSAVACQSRSQATGHAAAPVATMKIPEPSTWPRIQAAHHQVKCHRVEEILR
jgi:hypothetical protein